MILTGLCRVDKALFLYPESRVPDTVICKRMAVSGTPLSPSFGTQEGKGERSNTCGGNPHHTPHGTGTLLTLRAMTAWADHTHPHATASRSAAVTHTDFGWSAHAVMAHGKESPCPLCLILHSTLRHVRHLHTQMARKCCRCRNYPLQFLVQMLPSGTCFLPCKGTSRQLDGIGFHSEHIGNLPFRAGFESVFPTFSAQTFRMPCS